MQRQTHDQKVLKRSYCAHTRTIQKVLRIVSGVIELIRTIQKVLRIISGVMELKRCRNNIFIALSVNLKTFLHLICIVSMNYHLKIYFSKVLIQQILSTKNLKLHFNSLHFLPLHV